MATDGDDGRDQLAALRREFATVMAERLEHIEAMWKRVSESWDEETLSELSFYVHRMSGSAGSFGYLEVSRAAHDLEMWLKPWLGSDRSPDAGERAEAAALVERMCHGAET